MTRRTRGASEYVNHCLVDAGRVYRIVLHGRSGQVMLVGMKCKAAGERLLHYDGRRARQLVKKLRGSVL